MLHLSLRAKLIGAFILVLLPVLGLLLTNLQKDQARQEQVILSSQLQTADAIGNQVDEGIDGAISLGQVVAEDPLVQSMDPNVLDPYLQKVVRRTRSTSNVSVYDARGINRGWGDPTQPAEPRLSVAEMPYYRPYFEATISSNRPTVSDVLLLRRPLSVGFIVSVPIRNSVGRPIGVVAVTQRADVLAARFAALGLMPGETVFLTDPTGRLAFTTAYPNLPYDQSDAYANFAPLQMALRDTTAQSIDFTDPLQGDQRLGSFAATRKYDWVVGVTIPRATALAPLQETIRLQIIAFGVIVLLSISLAVLLAQLLLAPVRSLEEAARALGHGDLSHRVRIRTGDELDQLGGAFNQMASQLERQRGEVMDLLGREEAISQTAQALVREVELPKVVDLVIRQSVAVLHVDAVGMWRTDPTRRSLDLLAQHNLTPETVLALHSVSYDAPFLAALAARTEKPQIVEDVRTGNVPPDLRAIYRREGLSSVLALPLCARGRLVGVMAFATRTPHHFTPREMEFNTTLAGLFAVAMENARLYEQVQDALRLREGFIAAAAHELRTPITVIRGRSELTLRKDAHEEPARSTLQTVVRQADRIARLADDLLTVTRLRPGFTALQPTRFDVSRLVDDVAERTAATDTRYQFRVDADGPLEVDADRRLIGEALENLLENAERYSTLDGPIEVTARRENGSAIVVVTDHGVGIAPERQPYVFEPFFEPVAPGAPGYTGVVSLGLYLSKQIIDANGGQIRVSSTPGKGSSFSFTLPLAIPPGSGAARSPTDER